MDNPVMTEFSVCLLHSWLYLVRREVLNPVKPFYKCYQGHYEQT